MTTGQSSFDVVCADLALSAGMLENAIATYEKKTQESEHLYDNQLREAERLAAQWRKSAKSFQTEIDANMGLTRAAAGEMLDRKDNAGKQLADVYSAVQVPSAAGAEWELTARIIATLTDKLMNEYVSFREAVWVYNTAIRVHRLRKQGVMIGAAVFALIAITFGIGSFQTEQRRAGFARIFGNSELLYSAGSQVYRVDKYGNSTRLAMSYPCTEHMVATGNLFEYYCGADRDWVKWNSNEYGKTEKQRATAGAIVGINPAGDGIAYIDPVSNLLVIHKKATQLPIQDFVGKSFDFSADGTFFAYQKNSRAIVISDGYHERTIRTNPYDSPMLKWDHSGNYIAIATRDTLDIIDLKGNIKYERQLKFDISYDFYPSPMAWSPDDRYIAYTRNRTVYIWEAGTENITSAVTLDGNVRFSNYALAWGSVPESK